MVYQRLNDITSAGAYLSQRTKGSVSLDRYGVGETLENRIHQLANKWEYIIPTDTRIIFDTPLYPVHNATMNVFYTLLIYLVQLKGPRLQPESLQVSPSRVPVEGRGVLVGRHLRKGGQVTLLASACAHAHGHWSHFKAQQDNADKLVHSKSD